MALRRAILKANLGVEADCLRMHDGPIDRSEARCLMRNTSSGQTVIEVSTKKRKRLQNRRWLLVVGGRVYQTHRRL